MAKKKSRPIRLFVFIVLVYVFGNILFFLLNPFSSPWHYHTVDPEPIPVTRQDDITLSVNEITRILDEIDLAYGARKPTTAEQAKSTTMSVVSLVFLPASIGLGMKEFVGYIGSANSKQQVFTLSVKKRYNHLARLALSNGMKRDGYLFAEEPSLSKQNGESFHSLRTSGSDKLNGGNSQQPPGAYSSSEKTGDLKEIEFMDVVRFKIPADWLEEYSEKGGTIFYDSNKSIELRLNLVTLLRKDERISHKKMIEELQNIAWDRGREIEILPNGNALLEYTEISKKSGEDVQVIRWQLANHLPPNGFQIVLFSCRIFEPNKEAYFKELLGREIRNANFIAGQIKTKNQSYSFQKKTPLMSAVRQNRVETVKVLIDNGADVNAKIQGNTEVTALMIAARYGYTEIMKILIDNGADVNAKSDSGYTALMRAARNGQTKAVKILIQNHAAINLYNNGGVNYDGVSALWHAAKHNHLDIVNMLLENGANPDDIKNLPEISSNPARVLSRTYLGRKINQTITIFGFFSIMILGIVSLVRLSTGRKRLLWDISIPVGTILLFFIYNSAIQPDVYIRIDLLIIYPVLFFVVVSGVVSLVRASTSKSVKDSTNKGK